MIDEKIIEDILARVDIVDVVTEYVPNLKKEGASYIACCPFHTEKTPSFRVLPATGKWRCFGACQEGGNAIKFVMKIESCSFPVAVKKLADKYGIRLIEDKNPPSESDRQKQLLKESQVIVNEFAAEFYAASLLKDEKAKKYVIDRWGDSYYQEAGLGFAPNAWDTFLHEAQSKGYSVDVMLGVGLLKKNEDSGRIYDAYRNRIMIPIRDRLNRCIGFTARDLGKDSKAPKYINSPNSDIYTKDLSVFGINTALKQAIKEERFFCVEGAPDVMRLQSIGIYNTIASLGSAWTDNQFKLLKKYVNTLCFLPDADSIKQDQVYGTGIAAVMKNGARAMRNGFNVCVREIPLGEGNEKQDPDSFCTTKSKFDLLDEEDFIMWYARYEMYGKTNTEDIHAAISEICKLIACINDEMRVDICISKLTGAYKFKDIWRKGIKMAKKMAKSAAVIEKGKAIDRDLYGKYGFAENNNCYFSIKEEKEYYWSNFSMEPMFHIKDALMPKRLYKIRNASGASEIIEMKQEDLISLARFKMKVEGLGNYIWLASDRELTKLKMFLYEQTETAKEIVQLGWQREGFFAFGNGVFDTEWHSVDEYGIVRLDDNKNYYLPASSQIYRDENKLFEFERRFVHLNLSAISLREFSEKMIKVFDTNAKVGLCFLLATIFRDIIVDYTKTFPILNLFGPKGTGKTEMGQSLMSFFINLNTAPNIQNATIASMADLVAQCANALVHIDEYKNCIDVEKREFLKGLWDGAGRSRMNMDRDKKREITRVDSGVILSGQEMATADVALFSRFVYLTFDQDTHSEQERKYFNDLETTRKRGCTHLTLQILRHRALVQSQFIASHKKCMKDVQIELGDDVVEDRILKNWVIPLAAFYTLSPVLDLPFTYDEMLKVMAQGIIKQNSQCKSSNDLSNFWNTVSYMQQDGSIFNEADYRIEYVHDFKSSVTSAKMEFTQAKRILMVRLNRVVMQYKKVGRMIGDSVLPAETLKSYLEHSKEYMGYKSSVRFRNIMNGQDVTRAVSTPQGTSFKKTSTVDRAICFDYDLIQSNFNINLEVDTYEGGLTENQNQYE